MLFEITIFFFFLISLGKIVDIEVKSKYCKACEYWKNKLDTAVYEECLETHANHWQSNHKGWSGKMGVDAVIEMFQHSRS